MYGAWRQCANERGIASIMAIFIMVMMLVAGIFLVRMSSTEGEIAYGSVAAEGSFFAADAAINVGVARVDLLPPLVVAGGPCATSAPIGNYTYTLAAGTGADANCFLNTIQKAGYSIGSGTGYNPGGFVFYNYAMTGSGTPTPSALQPLKQGRRAVDAQVSFGPVAQ